MGCCCDGCEVGGSALFSIADSTVLPQFHPVGVLYCSLSLIADSVTLHLQVRPCDDVWSGGCGWISHRG